MRYVIAIYDGVSPVSYWLSRDGARCYTPGVVAVFRSLDAASSALGEARERMRGYRLRLEALPAGVRRLSTALARATPVDE